MYIVVSMVRVCVSLYLYMYMYIHVHVQVHTCIHAMWLAVLQCLRMCEPDGMPTFNNEKLGNYRLPIIVYTESLLV